MNILVKEEVRQRMPDEIERHLRRITGQLVCSKCKKVLVDDGIEYDDHISEPLTWLISAHICGREARHFEFDFKSPLTMREQILAMKPGDSFSIPDRKPKPRW